MSRQITLGHFGFKKSIPQRGGVTKTVIPDFVEIAIHVISTVILFKHMNLLD